MDRYFKEKTKFKIKNLIGVLSVQRCKMSNKLTNNKKILLLLYE